MAKVNVLYGAAFLAVVALGITLMVKTWDAVWWAYWGTPILVGFAAGQTLRSWREARAKIRAAVKQ